MKNKQRVEKIEERVNTKNTQIFIPTLEDLYDEDLYNKNKKLHDQKKVNVTTEILTIKDMYESKGIK